MQLIEVMYVMVFDVVVLVRVVLMCDGVGCVFVGSFGGGGCWGVCVGGVDGSVGSEGVGSVNVGGVVFVVVGVVVGDCWCWQCFSIGVCRVNVVVVCCWCWQC